MHPSAAIRRLPAYLAKPQNALLLAVLAAIPAMTIDALSDPDIWWHIKQGDWILQTHQFPRTELFSYAALGTPIVAHEWLAEVIFAAVNSVGGLFLVALLAGTFCWSGFLALALLLRRNHVSAEITAVALLLAAKTAEPVLGARPQIATFVFAAWVLLLADHHLRTQSRTIWLLPPIMLIWANVHAGFVTGIGLLFAFLLVEWINGSRSKTLIYVLLASLIAGCFNPQGPALYQYAVGAGASISGLVIQEWQSPSFHDISLFPLLLMLATLPLLLGLQRISLRWTLLAAAGAAWSLFAVRNIAVGAAMMIPAWGLAAENIPSRFLRFRRRTVPPKVSASILGAIIVLAGAGATGVVVSRTAQAASPAGIARQYPSCIAAILDNSPLPQRVFVTFFNAGYIVGTGYPQVLVYEYGALPDPSGTLLTNYLRIAAGATDSPSAIQLLQQSQTTAAVTSDPGLISLLRSQPDWNAVTSDQGLVLFAKAGSSIFDQHCS